LTFTHFTSHDAYDGSVDGQKELFSTTFTAFVNCLVKK